MFMTPRGIEPLTFGLGTVRGASAVGEFPHDSHRRAPKSTGLPHKVPTTTGRGI